MQSVGSAPDGLAAVQIPARRQHYGANVLAVKNRDGLGRRLCRSFINPFSAVLLVLACVSFITDYLLAAAGEKDLTAVLIVAGMVLASGTLHFVQEARSGNALARLEGMVKTTIAVLREGRERELPIAALVVGDVVRLAAGDMIPADMRVVKAKDLFVSQASLTGESGPVEKFAQALPADPARQSPLDCDNLVFLGSNVLSGAAHGVVLAVGGATLFGSLARQLSVTAAPTSFDTGLTSVSWLLLRLMACMAPVVFLLNGLTKGDWVEAAVFALSVAVGLTPEMLPTVVSANLVRGAVFMARKKVIVRRLNAIQNLGAMDVLCTDKTGTLTQDRIILEYSRDIHGNDDDNVLRCAFLNSWLQTGLKNLLDAAVVSHAEEKRMQDLRQGCRLVDEMPFDFSRRRMSVVVENQGGNRQIITKGALEEMLGVCAWARDKGADVPLTPELRREIAAHVRRCNADGLRVVAVAVRAVEAAPRAYTVADEREMTLLGFLAFLDPPKESAARAVSALEAHGVRVKVLTGDNDAVTRSVCRQVGLPDRRALLGADLEGMDAAALSRAVEEADIFAKLNPLQKARIVACLRGNGHVVGFMGDGINDAPAMKNADVAVSVDTAVDVARESAGVILLEKDLTVLEAGVMEGRRTYVNILKYIKITVSSNFGNMLSVLTASLLLPFLPMTPLQILVLNLLYDLSCTAMPWDNVDADMLARPSVWNRGGIQSFMLWFGPVSSLFDLCTFALLFWVICPAAIGGGWAGLDPGGRAAFAALFQAGWFVESIWTQSLVLHMLRTPRAPLLQSRAAWQVSLLTFLGVAVGTAIPFASLGRWLEMSPPPAAFFPWLLAVLVGYLGLVSVVKLRYVRRQAWL
ncbi:Mg2+-importing ATPase [Desulfovibrio legallii]|uniref:Magnesium-transporting ATPase, P-type 1 n=1 Tax=Desulfovibrio legallii TaxID=571438 RepID=A0A1G7P9H7_9BACT|nr:Mg2+-importing ATPase [Desulfovibrio legallii]